MLSPDRRDTLPSTACNCPTISCGGKKSKKEQEDEAEVTSMTRTKEKMTLVCNQIRVWDDSLTQGTEKRGLQAQPCMSYANRGGEGEG